MSKGTTYNVKYLKVYIFVVVFFKSRRCDHHIGDRKKKLFNYSSSQRENILLYISTFECKQKKKKKGIIISTEEKDMPETRFETFVKLFVEN